jgi:non-ribosomal peptide synthase protein (TIGR01720 family)
MFATSTIIYDPDPDETFSIGSGVITNTWIVDSQDSSKLAPVGAVGELWLEGPGVGRGYFGNPEKTAATFVKNPRWLLEGYHAGGIPGRRGRLYRTGDLVRYGQDNIIFFIGRKDAQVKIRGQRIELGEVEHHVQKLLPPRAEGAHVVIETVPARETGKPALAAFICPRDASTLTLEENQSEVAAIGAELNERLFATVPAYMVPTMYVPVQKMPMLATGKTDRRRLRELGATNDWSMVWNKANLGGKLPSTPLEEILRDVWSQVIGLPAEAITVDTTFTRLGGDSISAMQVCSRCRAKEISVTVAEILKYQTIEQIAPRCKELSTKAVFAEDGADGVPWNLSPVQQMHFDGHPNGVDHFNQAFLLRARTPVSTEELAAATTAVVERHAMLRARYSINKKNGYWEQYVAPTSSESFHFSEMDIEDENEALEHARRQQKTLHIVEGPVFSLIVFNVKGSEMKLIAMSGHHLVIDLMSWRIIWQDLVDYLQDKNTFLPPPISFQIWSKMQKKEALQLSHHKTLPFDIQPPQFEYWGPSCLEKNTHEDSELYVEIIDAETTALLLGESNESLRTEPIDLMLAALIASFCQTFAERRPPTIFLEGHGREPIDGVDVDLSETVSWFTTMYPIQVGYKSDKSFVDLVGMIKDYRRSVPGKGRPWFAYSLHTQDGREKFQQQWPGELLFNYMGQFQQLERHGFFERVPCDLQAVSTTMGRMALIEVNSDIQEGELHMGISINKYMAHQEQLQTWRRTFSFCLKEVANVMNTTKRAFTPSDFPLLQTSNTGLNNLILSIGLPEEEIVDIYPCTAIQEGILLSIQKSAATYENTWIWECSGKDISPSRIEQAWRRCIQRHSILSNIFVENPEAGGFVQVELKNPTINVEHVSTVGNPTGILFERSKPVYGSRLPQHLFTISHTSDGSAACRLDMNHALIDASSIPVLVRDLANFYTHTVPLSSAPKFQDVVGFMQNEPKDSGIEYWNNFLRDVQVCELPASQTEIRNDEAHSSPYGYTEIKNNLIGDIDKWCRDHEVTRAVLLEIAWGLVLSIYTNKSDVCFGYVSSGRDIDVDGVHNAVGPLICLLLARIDLDKPTSEVLNRTYKDSAEHFNHQHTSLAEIQHQLGFSNRRLFNTAVTIRESSDHKSNGDIKFTQVHVEDSNEVCNKNTFSLVQNTNL